MEFYQLEESKIGDEMKDKIIVITGASDGIGAEAARKLSAMGAEVVIVGRSPEKTKALALELKAKYYLADYTKLDEVRRLAGELNRDYPRIDVLANNAGGIFGKRETTIDGHEKTMQVNYLAPFLLTNLLIDNLIASKTAVINTSSIANKILSRFDIDDLELEKNYNQRVAYGNTKLENILFTKELNKRFHAKGISTVAFHPGNVATNFASDTSDLLRYIYHTPLKKLVLISPKKGADTLVWLASTVADKDWKSGGYYYKRKLSNKIAPAANNETYARSLWDQSEKFINQGNS
jgi:NAD(P)-dependent dehydrogenase (short-subunit alcohol dehydrogenase family)